MGLTPGKSTRTQAERVLGKPVQNASRTLIEYAPKAEADKLYVQYRDASSDAVVDRIEMTCTHDGWGTNTPNSLQCIKRWYSPMLGEYGLELSARDCEKKSDNPVRVTSYFGSPRFIVLSVKPFPGPKILETYTFAFYSRELFENAVPERNCTGT